MEIKYKAILTCLVMIFSSLAGCTATNEDTTNEKVDEIINENSNQTQNNQTQNNQTQNESLVDPLEELRTLLADKKIMVSTYHVQQLVLAVVGNTAEVDIIGSSNTPVHDFTPSPGDTQDLLESDIFFYHGLKLEPWVNRAIYWRNHTRL